MTYAPVLLCILDGWGHREETDFNAVSHASTPHYDALLKEAACGVIDASSEEVGLPKGQMGNSEVGHMNIGGGRKPQQVITRINTARNNDAQGITPNPQDDTIESIKHNSKLLEFVQKLQQSKGACHLLGICSDGKVHGDIEHVAMLAALLADRGITVWIHAITDGRDTDARVAKQQLAQLEASITNNQNIHIATISGRAFSMDRDKNWDRIERAYAAMVDGVGFDLPNVQSALDAAYERGESDEDMQPSVIFGYEKMQPEDGLLMTNFRPDRARQIMAAFTMESFDGFARKTARPQYVLGMANYWDEDMPLQIPAMFDMEVLPNTLGEVLQQNGKTQLRIAETEKYAHVTSFFSGNNPTFEGETRTLVASPKVASYADQPEMSAPEVTKALLEAIETERHDVFIVNYANPDMVGHTGDFEATIKAIEAVDSALGELRTAIRKKGGTMLITADHGNADMMRTPNDEPNKKHTTNPVPFIVDSALYTKHYHIAHGGSLSDIAPTILDIMSIAIPKEMTGQSLLCDTRSISCTQHKQQSA